MMEDAAAAATEGRMPPGGRQPEGNTANTNNEEDEDLTTTTTTATETEPESSMLIAGRVVRLHFTCRAELPMGSFLRVTGSSLWAPGTCTVQDPADAAVSVDVVEESAFRLTEADDYYGAGSTSGGMMMHGLYTSSVEMVTTPEDYPVWRTRKPVVVVLSSRKKTIQHHYYRYLVVSPGGGGGGGGRRGGHGGGGSTVIDPFETDNEDEDQAASGGGDDSMIISTSNEDVGSTAVVQWEDSFGTLSMKRSKSGPNASSTLSLTSSVVNGQAYYTTTDYRNLPYRTCDIDVMKACAVAATASASDGGTGGSDNNNIIMDYYGNPDDVTFRPYLIREAIHEENRRKQLAMAPSQQSRLADVSGWNGGGGGDGDIIDEDADMEEDQNSIDAAVKDAVAAVMSTAANTATNTSMSGTCTPLLPMGNNLRIFFVCFHLPVVVVQNPRSGQWRASWSESILAKTEGSRVLLAYEAYWVGTVTTHPPLQTEEDKIAVRKILDEMHCIPIFLDKDLRQAHYNGFCKQVLWPAFHNIDLLDLSTCGWLPDGGASNSSSSTSDWDQSRMDGWWQSFSKVNQEFCTVMHSLTNPNDILWIHDYHLSLLPQQLTELEMEKCGRRLTRKVFFLHIPFPTSQIFRELECGESILQGMLHADVVGFHAFDHARHFLNAAKRILGLNYESLVGGLIGVNYQGKTVLVSMSNVSIEPRMVDAALMLPSVQAGMEELKKKHEGRTIIGAVDIGQRLSGTSLKLLAYERLLQDYPLWQSRAVMVERLLLPGSRQKDEEVTTREVRFLVKRIQDKFGPHVIDYQEVTGTSLPMDQRLALWKASAILMSTPIREGLNHWPMEFIYAHKEPEAPGVVIASEFSAISSILNGALRVNPYDIQMMITTIDKALSMDMQEREGRRYRDIDFVSNSPSDKWVKNVLRDLRDATMRQPARDGGDTNSQSSTPFQNDGTQTPIRKDLIDSTAAFLARESSINFAHLNIHETKRAYDSCHRRVIITDFNGTIVHKEPPGKYLKREILGTSGNKPPPDVIDALVSLCNDPKNLVYVVSGDSVENVLNALGHIPNLGLAVSNGARFSPPMSPGQSERRWLTFDLGVDWDAVKRVALPVLSKYTARSNGSFVKLTSFSIGWSYYSCDPEWGSLQAAHLVLELESELRAFDVRFVTLKGIVEVVPRRLNKGLVVKKVLRDVAVQHPDEGPDFILCLGDDISDEKMFTSVFSFLADVGDESNSKAGPPVILDAQGQREEEGQSAVGLFMDGKSPALSANATPRLPERIYAYTVAVGKKQSHANTFVNDAQDVANALVLLSRGEIPAGGVPVWGRVSRLFE